MSYYFRLSAIFCLVLLFAVSVQALPTSPVNYQVSSSSAAIQNGEGIASDPVDINQIVLCWQDFRSGYNIGIGRSEDGGGTWSEQFLNSSLHLFDRLIDPILISDQSGNFYLSMIDYQPLDYPDSSYITFLKSTDGGLTWDGPHTVCDTIGPYLERWHEAAVDNTDGPNQGYIYVTWVRQYREEDDSYGPENIMFSRSTDGAETFDEPAVIVPQIDVSICPGFTVDYLGAGRYPTVLVGGDGAVYVFWNQYLVITSPEGCVLTEYYKQMIKSTDGGQSWSEPVLVAKNDLDLYAIDGGILIEGTPIVAADAGGGQFDGNLYVTYTGLYSYDVYESDYNIEFVKSTDGGLTWSEPIYVNDDYIGDDAVIDQFHPSMACDENGIITITWYDQRTDPDNHYKFDLYAAYSFDGGETFTANHRISDVSIDPDLMVNLGYGYLQLAYSTGVTCADGQIRAVWTDTRNGSQDIYGAGWDLPLLGPRLLTLSDGAIVCENGKLEWAASWKLNDDEYLVEISSDPSFATIAVSATVPESHYDMPPEQLTDGVNYWRVKTYKISTGESSDYSEVGSFYLDMAAPLPAVPVLPEPGAVVFTALPEFEWYQIGHPVCPVYYDLEICPDYYFNPNNGLRKYYDLTELSFIPPDPLEPNITYYWHVRSKNWAGVTMDFGMTASVQFQPFDCGDVSRDGKGDINILDVVYLINYIYKDGPAPEPMECGNVNGDDDINILDIVYLINFIYKSGPDLNCP